MSFVVVFCSPVVQRSHISFVFADIPTNSTQMFCLAEVVRPHTSDRVTNKQFSKALKKFSVFRKKALGE